MYGKLFESIYDGTLVEDWQALITFQQMIILCDSDGVLDMTIGAISRRTGIPAKHIKHGIEILEGADPESRSPNEEGKRIIRIDEHRAWGWTIVNHKHYRDLRTSNDRREYMRQYMRDKRKKLTKANKSLQVSKLANTDTDTDTDTLKAISSSTKTPSVPYQKIIDLYHEKLPTLPKVAKLTAKRKSQIRQRWSEDMPKLDNWIHFFEYVAKSDFLMGKKESFNGRPPFRADIEWITNQTNFTKIAEEKYHV